MSKKDRPLSITLRTLPNGYALTVKGEGTQPEEYLYTTLDKLLAGFFVRVGLKETKVMTTEDIEHLMLICLNYHRHQSDIKQIFVKDARKRGKEKQAAAQQQYYEQLHQEQHKEPHYRAPKPLIDPLPPSPVICQVTEKTMASLNIQIRNTRVNTRTLHAACNAISALRNEPPSDYYTLADLARYSEAELKAVRSVGIGAIAKLKAMLLLYDMYLGMDIDALTKKNIETPQQ